MQDDLNLERRYQPTRQKSVYLTEFGRNKIEAWAQAEGVNFSAAIETLALMGLEDSRAEYAIPALRATALQGLRLVFNRMAGLLSDIAIEAAATRTMSEGIMLQLIREMANTHPDEFEQMMRVQRDSRLQVDKRIRAFHDAIKRNVEQESIRRMREGIGRMEAMFFEEEPCQEPE